MTTALFIGRFQPFHNSHKRICDKILDECDKLAIGVGSAQYGYTKQNPFTYEERLRMICNALYLHPCKSGDEDYTGHRDASFTMTSIVESKALRIFPIFDIHDPDNWVEHAMESCYKRVDPPDAETWQVDIIYTTNDMTKKLFEKAGYKVKTLTDVGDTRASEVRELIGHKNNGLELQDSLSRQVYEFICHHGLERIWYLQRYGVDTPKYE